MISNSNAPFGELSAGWHREEYKGYQWSTKRVYPLALATEKEKEPENESAHVRRGSMPAFSVPRVYKKDQLVGTKNLLK